MMTSHWLQERSNQTAQMKKDEKRREFKKYKMKHSYKGSDYTLRGLADPKDCVVSYDTLRDRVKQGWQTTDAVTTRKRKGNHLTNDRVS